MHGGEGRSEEEDAASLGAILLVDDDEVFRERMARALVARGYQVETAANYEDALERALGARFTSAVLDLRMPGPSGLELLMVLRRSDPRTRIVILTGFGSIATTVEAMRMGAVGYLAKPVDAEELARELAGKSPAVATGGQPSTPSLALAEWEHIQRVLADAGGNKSLTARRLAITRRTLQLKLKKQPPSI